MPRAFAVAAWTAATACAAAVAWLGVDSVLIPAAETPPAALVAGAGVGQNSVITVTPNAPAVVQSPSASSPGHAGIASSPAGSSSAHSSAAASPSPSPSSTLSRYPTAGGVVVLALTATKATLVSATPAAGYSVQNWGAAGWLRVDFTKGSTVYSIYATWNGYSPQVQVVGPS